MLASSFEHAAPAAVHGLALYLTLLIAAAILIAIVAVDQVARKLYGRDNRHAGVLALTDDVEAIADVVGGTCHGQGCGNEDGENDDDGGEGLHFAGSGESCF